jgi:hypothetical protein
MNPHSRLLFYAYCINTAPVEFAVSMVVGVVCAGTGVSRLQKMLLNHSSFTGSAG